MWAKCRDETAGFLWVREHGRQLLLSAGLSCGRTVGEGGQLQVGEEKSMVV